jgi:hypothetical protein
MKIGRNCNGGASKVLQIATAYFGPDATRSQNAINNHATIAQNNDIVQDGFAALPLVGID